MNKTKFLAIISTLLINLLSAQVTCDGSLNSPFDEKDGLVVIEMESGVTNNSNWKVGTFKSNYTGNGYLYWDGSQSFSKLSNAPIEYNVKINTPGTYKFTWRMAIGLENNTTEHNDTWLKIDSDDFYGRKSNGDTVRPRPQCQSDPTADCPEGTSVNGFFKIYGNVLNWTWVSRTSDNDPHDIYATFNTAGLYKITIDARSSWCLLDRMVLNLTSVSENIAFNLNQPESNCSNTLSSNDESFQSNEIKIYPNPAREILTINNLPNNSELIYIKDIYGKTIADYKVESSKLIISTNNLQSGVYFMLVKNKNRYTAKKFFKI